MEKIKEIIYRPNQRYEVGFFRTIIVLTKNILVSKDLVLQLFKRDYLGAYKKSYLGATWVIISPLIGMVSWLFLKKTGLLKPGNVGVPYAAYLLMGTTMWGLFMGFFTAAATTFESTSYLVMQINCPREAVFAKQVMIHLANSFISFLIMVMIVIAFGIIPGPWALTLPLIILPLFFLGASLGLIMSMAYVVAPDLKKIVQAGMGLLIYTTPIIYSKNINHPLIKSMITWNPLTYLVCSARDIVIYGRLYDSTGFFVCAIASFLMFLVLTRLFYLAEDKIIERMI